MVDATRLVTKKFHAHSSCSSYATAGAINELYGLLMLISSTMNQNVGHMPT